MAGILTPRTDPRSEQLVVDIRVGASARAPRVVSGASTRASREGFRLSRVLKEAVEGLCEIGRIAGFEGEPRVADELSERGVLGSHDGAAASHGLARRETEALQS